MERKFVAKLERHSKRVVDQTKYQRFRFTSEDMTGKVPSIDGYVYVAKDAVTPNAVIIEITEGQIPRETW